MILKYLAVLSFCTLSPSGDSGEAVLSWRTLDDAGLHRLVKALEDRYSPVTVFGAPAVEKAGALRVRLYPRGTRDLLVVETRPTAEGEHFHAVRLRRAVETKAAGLEPGSVTTVWEIRSRGMGDGG
jgi:hypothetical protein